MDGILGAAWARHPDKPAILGPDTKLTFGELAVVVGRCARGLIDLGYDIVAIGARSKVEAIVLMLACVMARRPFVPIDLDRPVAVVREQLQELSQNAVIIGVDIRNGAMTVDTYNFQIAAGRCAELKNRDVLSVMFTSGSTGTPKGVLVPRYAVVNLLHEPGFFQLSEDDVFATYSPLSFDASTFEIFTPLLNGNTLVVLNKIDVIDSGELERKANYYGISCLWMTAGLFNEQVLSGRYRGLQAIRKLFVGGDRVDLEAANVFVRTSQNSILYNGYGPTENTVFTTVAELNMHSLTATGEVPIGLPVRGVECVLLDDDKNIVDGEGVGRLYIAGRGLSFGYLNRPEETAISFGQIDTKDEQIYYDSGDYVRRGKEGVYYFRGRRDRQIKIVGHRVDMGDLESRCLRHDLVEHVHAYRSSAVNGLVLVCKARDKQELNIKHYDEWLRTVLSDYERPKRIVVVDSWPLTETNKVDIRQIVSDAERQIKADAPSETNGSRVVDLVQDLLKIRVVDNTVSLFDIGFDSVSIAKLQVELERAYGIQIDMIELFEIATLDGLERRVHGSSVE